MPSSLRRILVYMSSSEPGPRPPSVNSCCSVSAIVLIFGLPSRAQTVRSLAPLPSQVNFVTSKPAPPGRAEQRRNHRRARQRNDGAVLGRDVVDMACGAQAAGARHVLHHDARLPGNVLAEIVRDHARVEIEAAAGRVAGDQRHRLALVEVRDRVRLCRRCKQPRRGPGHPNNSEIERALRHLFQVGGSEDCSDVPTGIVTCKSYSN